MEPPQNICLLEDIQCPLVIGLGSKDSLVPSSAARKYVNDTFKGSHRQDEVDLLWWEGKPHGYCLTSKAVKELVEVVEVQEERLGLRKTKQFMPRKGYEYTPGSAKTTVWNPIPPALRTG